jgi:hypothetical protein
VAERHRIGFVPQPLVKYRFHGGSISRNYERMSRERTEVITRGLALERGTSLSWMTRRQIWAETWRTNGWDAGRAGARLQALADYARAAQAWPLSSLPYREAVKVCLHV